MKTRKKPAKDTGYKGGQQISRTVALRYTLIQLPGTVLLVLVLMLIHRLWVPVPLWLGISIVAAAILKDILLFPLLWRSYSEGKTDVPSTMIGRRGIATSLLDPEGYVRVRGELWRGEVSGNIGRIEKGRAVIVVGISGLKLYVGPDSRAELEN